MVNGTLPSHIPFILSADRLLLFCHSALRGREERIFFADPQTHQVRSLPLAWTSLASPDPFLVIAAEHTVLRWKDLQQLVQFLRSTQTQHQEDQ